MAKATLFILIAAAAGLLVYLILAPRFVHGNPSQEPQPNETSAVKQPDQSANNATSKPSPNGNPNDSPPIDVPLTSEQRSQKDLEARRGPLYELIRTNMSSVLVGWQPSTADPATLNLYMARTDSSDISLCMNRIVEPYAAKYGFNHVGFFEPNPPDASDHWRLDSEATPDEAGSWHLYKK